MLARILAEANEPCAGIEIGILYRGEDDSVAPDDAATEARIAAERQAAERLFAISGAQLELTADSQAYRDAVRALVTAPNSVGSGLLAAGWTNSIAGSTPACAYTFREIELKKVSASSESGGWARPRA